MRNRDRPRLTMMPIRRAKVMSNAVMAKDFFQPSSLTKAERVATQGK